MSDMTFREWWEHKGTSAYNQCPRWIEQKISEKVWEAATLAERERCLNHAAYYANNSVVARSIFEAIRKGD